MNIYDFTYVFMVCTVGILFMPHMNRDRDLHRALIIAFIGFLAFRYFYWRFFDTVWPVEMPTIKGAWIWICFIFECLAITESTIFYLTMLKHSNHSKQADLYESALRQMDPKDLPTIDIFLPTYNEGIDVLERSILGALNMDWPKDKLKVWVLDDGARDWLKEYCESKGAGYIRRFPNLHAKAGNINHAFNMTDGKFVVVFDADFVGYKNFLYRTVGFFADPKVAIVQTPQHFFNKDFVQANLHLHDDAPDDQRIFFDMMMPARDAWGATFWCGSCSISRRSAMQECGGVPTNSIVEDLMTSLVLLRKGYVTRYLNEKLSHGLAPESLEGLIVQRKRWCRGSIQSLFSPDGPIRSRNLSIMQRVLFMPVYWIFNPITRFMILLIPVVFLWTGTPALLINHYAELIFWQFPMLLMNFFSVLWLTPRQFIPLLSNASASIHSIQILPTMIHSFIKPYAKGFGVTPKGLSHKKQLNFHSPSLIISAVFFIITGIGLIINLIPEIRPVYDDGFFPIAAFMAIINMITLAFMVMLSFEHPRWRQDERFQITANIKGLIDGAEHPLQIRELSVGGAKISVFEPLELNVDSIIELTIDSIGKIKAKVVNFSNHSISVAFQDVTPEIRDRLIVFIYAEQHDNASIIRNYAKVYKGLFHRMFVKH